MGLSVSFKVQFVLPEPVYLLQNNLSCLLHSSRSLIYLLVAFRNLFERNRRLAMRMGSKFRDFDVHDGFIGPT